MTKLEKQLFTHMTSLKSFSIVKNPLKMPKPKVRDLLPALLKDNLTNTKDKVNEEEQNQDQEIDEDYENIERE